MNPRAGYPTYRISSADPSATWVHLQKPIESVADKTPQRYYNGFGKNSQIKSCEECKNIL